MARHKTPWLLIVVIVVLGVLVSREYLSRMDIAPPGGIAPGTESIANMIYSPAFTSTEQSRVPPSCDNVVSFRSNDPTSDYGQGDWISVNAVPDVDNAMEGYIFDRVVQTSDPTQQGAAIYDIAANKIRDRNGNWINRYWNPVTNQQEVWVYKSQQHSGEFCTDQLGNQNLVCSDFSTKLICSSACTQQQCTRDTCYVSFRHSTDVAVNGYQSPGMQIAVDYTPGGNLECFEYNSFFTSWSAGQSISIGNTPEGYGIYKYSTSNLIINYGSHGIYAPASPCRIPVLTTPQVGYSSTEISKTWCCDTTIYTYYVFKSTAIAETSNVPVQAYSNTEVYATDYQKYYCSQDNSEIRFGKCNPYSATYTVVEECDLNECGDPTPGDGNSEVKCAGARPYKINSELCIQNTDGTGILYTSDSTGYNYVTKPCPKGCAGNVCKECTPSTYRCNNNVRQVCDTSYKWTNLGTCAVGCIGSQVEQTTQPSCTQTCTPNRYYCGAISGGVGIMKCDATGETMVAQTPTAIGCAVGCSSTGCLHECNDCDTNSDGTIDGCSSATSMCALTCVPNIEDCVGNIRTKCSLTTEANDYYTAQIGTCQTYDGRGGCVDAGITTSCSNVCPDNAVSGVLCYTDTSSKSSEFTCTNSGKTLTWNKDCAFGCENTQSCRTYCRQFGASANQPFCQGDLLYTCNADESGTTGTPVQCAAGCTNGRCNTVCAANSLHCFNGDVYRCGTDGLVRTLQNTCGVLGCSESISAGAQCNSVCSPKGQYYCCDSDRECKCSTDGTTIETEKSCGGALCESATGRCGVLCTDGQIRCSAELNKRERCTTGQWAYNATYDCQSGCDTNTGQCTKICSLSVPNTCSTDKSKLLVCGCGGECYASQIACKGRCSNSECEDIVFRLAQTTLPFGETLSIPIDVKYSKSLAPVTITSMNVLLKQQGVVLRTMNGITIYNGTATPQFLALTSGGQYSINMSVYGPNGLVTSEQPIYLSKDVVVVSESVYRSLWIDELKTNKAIPVVVKDGLDPVDVSGATVVARINNNTVTAVWQKNPSNIVGYYDIFITNPVVGTLALTITPIQIGQQGQQVALTPSNLVFDIAEPTLMVTSTVTKTGSQIELVARVTARGTATDADSVVATIQLPSGQSTTQALTKIRTGYYSYLYPTTASGSYSVNFEALKTGYQEGTQQASIYIGDHCTNSIKDGDETDVDCGGADCGACSDIDNKTALIIVGAIVVVAVGYMVLTRKKGRGRRR